MHFRLNSLDLRINTFHNGSQGTKSRNYFLNIRAPTWSFMRSKRNISLVLDTGRDRSGRLALRIHNILRPS